MTRVSWRSEVSACEISGLIDAKVRDLSLVLLHELGQLGVD